MAEQGKPCEATCPKCGSGDVNHRHYARNTTIDTPTYGKPQFTQDVSGQGWNWYATREFLRHICGVCRYAWHKKPLAKPKKGTVPV